MALFGLSYGLPPFARRARYMGVGAVLQGRIGLSPAQRYLPQWRGRRPAAGGCEAPAHGGGRALPGVAAWKMKPVTSGGFSDKDTFSRNWLLQSFCDERRPVLEVSDFDKLKFALSAYNDANRQSNRMWSAAALLAVFVFTAQFGAGDRSILGIELNSEYVLPAAVIVLSGLNIAYSVAHVSAYRIAAVYRSIVEESFGKTVPATKDFSWFDLALRAPISNFNRLYPLFLPIERNVGRGPYVLIKTTFDIVYCGFPSFAIAYGLWSLPPNAPLYKLAAFVALLSLFAMLFLMRWVVRWPRVGSD